MEVIGYLYLCGNVRMEINELSDRAAWNYIRKNHLAPGKLYRIQKVEVPAPQENINAHSR